MKRMEVARLSSDGSTVRVSGDAVALYIDSNFVGYITGRDGGLKPLGLAEAIARAYNASLDVEGGAVQPPKTGEFRDASRSWFAERVFDACRPETMTATEAILAAEAAEAPRAAEPAGKTKATMQADSAHGLFMSGQYIGSIAHRGGDYDRRGLAKEIARRWNASDKPPATEAFAKLLNEFRTALDEMLLGEFAGLQEPALAESGLALMRAPRSTGARTPFPVPDVQETYTREYRELILTTARLFRLSLQRETDGTVGMASLIADDLKMMEEALAPFSSPAFDESGFSSGAGPINGRERHFKIGDRPPPPLAIVEAAEKLAGQWQDWENKTRSKLSLFGLRLE